MGKAVSGILLMLLLVGTFTLAFDIRPALAQVEPISINSDGSISPSYAPILTVDNVTYTFTGNINYPSYNGIVVERNNIVIDGMGYTVKGDQDGNGLSLTDISNVTIKNANIQSFYYGIYILDSNNNVIIRNDAVASSCGILLWASSNNTVSGNTATGNGFEGIWLDSSSNNVVSGNNATANYHGIWLDSDSNNNAINGNTATANSEYGIALDQSSGNVLSGNVIQNNGYNFGVFNDYGSTLSDFINSVDTSNLVKGNPVYYLTNQSNLMISPVNYPHIGYLALVNCTNMTVQGLTLTNNGQGVLLAFTNDSNVTNNTVANNVDGISLYASSNNTVSGNSATANSFGGISLDGSSNNNAVNENTATANSYGVSLYYTSNNNVISGNNETANADAGIELASSSNNTVSGNNIAANNVTANNDSGISLFSSSESIVSGNNVTANSYGIVLQSSSHNTAYHNNFVGNVIQASVDSASGGNAWDNGYPSGGNYWSDYNGTDLYSGPHQNIPGSDGIGDTPYVIDSNDMDHYPLMKPYLLSVSVWPTSVNIDLGLSQPFNSTTSGGTPPYSYQWYLNGTAWSGATSPAWNFTPSSAGNCQVYLNITDSLGFTAQSNIVSVTVNQPPVVVIDPSNIVMDVGQSQTFNSTVSGGTGPYTYQWYLNGIPQSNATTPAWTFTPSSPGSNIQVYVEVTDNSGTAATSNTATVNVNGPPSVSVVPGSGVMDVGQSQLFNSTVSGGTSAYSYQWYLNGSPVSGATSTTWQFTPASAGSYTVYLNITDSANATATSNNVSVTVNGPLSINIAPNSTIVDVDQPLNLTSTVTGGTSPFTYQWYLNGSAVQGATAFTWIFSPNSTGFYNVYVSVTDAVGFTAQSNFASAAVNPQLSVIVSPTLVVIDVGQSQTFNSTVSGGTSPYTYQWYLNGTAVPGANSSGWAFTATSAGSYTVYANVTDSVGAQATSNTSAVTVNTKLTVSISPSSVVINVGQSQPFASNVSGGTGPFSYQWYLNGTPVFGATNTTWTFTSTSTGSCTVYVNVTDSVGVQVTSNRANITVGVHDVAVTNVLPFKTVVGQGYRENITVTAANLGTYPETFNLTIYANTAIITWQNVALSAGDSENLTITWNTTGFAYGNYTLNAYASPVPGETNITNNYFASGVVKVTIPGDLNGDFKVNLSDLSLLAKAYGSTPSSSNWNANADINGDGKVSLLDLQILSKNYGKSVTPSS